MQPIIQDTSHYPPSLVSITSPITTLQQYKHKTLKPSGKRTIPSHTPSISLLDKLSIVTHLHLPESLPYKLGSYKKSNYFIYEEKSSLNEIIFSENIFYRKHGENLYLTLNPSHFDNCPHLDSCFLSIFQGDKEILNSPVIRTDCTVDVYRSFEEERLGVDFGSKKSFETFKERYSSRNGLTGFHVGEDTKSSRAALSMYDKQLERNMKGIEIDFPWTRYETNSFPKGLLLKNLHLICNHTPFSNIKRYHIEFISPSLTDHALLERFYKFKALVEASNFWWAKRELNTNRNFERDYGSFYKRIELQPSLDEIFQESIRRYFSQGGIQ
jgi:hypothetical protein